MVNNFNIIEHSGNNPQGFQNPINDKRLISRVHYNVSFSAHKYHSSDADTLLKFTMIFLLLNPLIPFINMGSM